MPDLIPKSHHEQNHSTWLTLKGASSDTKENLNQPEVQECNDETFLRIPEKILKTLVKILNHYTNLLSTTSKRKPVPSYCKKKGLKLTKLTRNYTKKLNQHVYLPSDR